MYLKLAVAEGEHDEVDDQVSKRDGDEDGHHRGGRPHDITPHSVIEIVHEPRVHDPRS